jgi:hypothetical protein
MRCPCDAVSQLFWVLQGDEGRGGARGLSEWRLGGGTSRCGVLAASLSDFALQALQRRPPEALEGTLLVGLQGWRAPDREDRADEHADAVPSRSE